MQIFAILVVRNEADVLEVNLRHHHAAGVDAFLVIDNGSTDATGAVLERLSRELPVLSWYDAGPFHQAAIATRLAREAFLRGADWVLPIDADEFWHAPNGMRESLGRANGVAARVAVRNFVQRREVVDRKPEHLETMDHRVAVPVSSAVAARECVESGSHSFVEVVFPDKVALRARPAVRLGAGAHAVVSRGAELPPPALIEDVVCLHAPLRSRAILTARMDDHGPRYRALHPVLGQSWQGERWHRLRANGGEEAEWRANSHREGCLDVGNVTHQLIFDPTLRDVVAPWIRATPSGAGQRVPPRDAKRWESAQEEFLRELAAADGRAEAEAARARGLASEVDLLRAEVAAAGCEAERARGLLAQREAQWQRVASTRGFRWLERYWRLAR